MEQVKQFYQIDNGAGVGVLLDGGCGFEIRGVDVKVEEDIKHCPMLAIRPLKYKQEPGTINEDNGIVEDAGFIGIAFGSAKSVEVMIEALTEIKEKCFDNKN